MKPKSKERAPTKEYALSEHTKKTTHNTCILNQILEILNSRLMAGELVHASDFPLIERPHYHAAIAVLRDKIPLRVRWRTKTESGLGDWKLRQRCYALPTELVTHPKGGEV